MTTKYTKRTQMRLKHVPQRTCVGCREVKSKRELIRIVRTDGGSIIVDPTGRLPGRGCYLCKSKSCWDSALQKERLDRALRTKATAEDRIALTRYVEMFAS
jgi:predicted RNA-binding protein YlxR (DUF448 family)